MRTQAERAKQPDQLPPGTEYVVLDILRDSSQAGAAQLLAVPGDPKAASWNADGFQERPWLTCHCY